MPPDGDCASSVENDAVRMASLIGFIMAQYPYARAAAAMATDRARDWFAEVSARHGSARDTSDYHKAERIAAKHWGG